ncbi:MAG: hypothetical protein PHO15_01860 [Eubacteriales bacterium]|nr:hypothetical protein [Eubacteriales bacterium]
MNKNRQIFGILGIGGVGIFLIAVIISIIGFEDGVYSPAHCFVSELGLYTGGYFALSSALAFNLGLIVSGFIICAFMFFYGLQQDTLLNAALSFTGILSGVLIAAQGIYTLNYAQYHYIVTTAYFISIFVICALYIVAEMLGGGQKKSGLAALIVAFLSGITSAVFAGYMLSGGMAKVFAEDAEAARLNVMRFAVIEWASYLLTFALIAMLAISMLRDKKSTKDGNHSSQNNRGPIVKKVHPKAGTRDIEL